MEEAVKFNEPVRPDPVGVMLLLVVFGLTWFATGVVVGKTF